MARQTKVAEVTTVKFPGYTYSFGKSEYKGEDPGEGGRVMANPGIYHDVALLDISSMHPSSIEALNAFGPYTKKYSELKAARIAIKHHDYAAASKMLDGKLAPFLTNEEDADQLAYALKIVINIVYGLTSAKFDNPFRDIRNVDNIVAKRGALFMIDLQEEVEKLGFTVAHIKTDSIKIPNATPEIIKFVMDFGKKYGYSFEHEATYERMCLVNNAVYIARFADPKWCEEHYGYAPKENREAPMQWTATGAQFAEPYVFKTLFSGEPISFSDLTQVKTVTTALYLDMNEDLGEDEHNYYFVGKAGLFCPIKPGRGGGILLRKKEDKYYSASNASGYRWLEAEMVEKFGKQDDIDLRFFEGLQDDARDQIAKYGSVEEFLV